MDQYAHEHEVSPGWEDRDLFSTIVQACPTCTKHSCEMDGRKDADMTFGLKQTEIQQQNSSMSPKEHKDLNFDFCFSIMVAGLFLSMPARLAFSRLAIDAGLDLTALVVASTFYCLGQYLQVHPVHLDGLKCLNLTVLHDPAVGFRAR